MSGALVRTTSSLGNGALRPPKDICKTLVWPRLKSKSSVTEKNGPSAPSTVKPAGNRTDECISGSRSWYGERQPVSIYIVGEGAETRVLMPVIGGMRLGTLVVASGKVSRLRLLRSSRSF